MKIAQNTSTTVLREDHETHSFEERRAINDELSMSSRKTDSFEERRTDSFEGRRWGSPANLSSKSVLRGGDPGEAGVSGTSFDSPSLYTPRTRRRPGILPGFG